MRKLTTMHGAMGVWILLILSALVCLGTGDRETSRQISAMTEYAGHEANPSPSGQPCLLLADNAANSISTVTSANKAFAFNLYRQLANQTDNQGKNVFFSPASVSLALAALSVGARGQTHQQLFSGLGFNSSLLNQADVNQAFHGLLTRASKTSSKDISAGTAVFVDNKFKPKAEFLETLSQSYLADAFLVDFNDPTESAAAINKYVGEKTHGRIDQLVEELDPDTLMNLISYVYYRGEWKTPFKDTTKAMFKVDEQTQVPVQMMSMQERFDVYYDKNTSTHVLRLPFKNSYSMLLMLPDGGRSLADLEDVICPMHYARWLSGLNGREDLYNVELPKFSIKTSVNLNDVLRKMGITEVFGAAGDLSGISEDQRLAVSQVVHQATLDVEETGATAAAVTDVDGATYCPSPTLSFNRPFMILIADSSDNIMFMGKIVNPNI